MALFFRMNKHRMKLIKDPSRHISRFELDTKAPLSKYIKWNGYKNKGKAIRNEDPNYDK